MTLKMPALEEQGLKELQSQPLVAKLATVSAEGDVRITPIWFRAEEDGSFLMNTFEQSTAVRNVRDNPRCSLLIDSTEFPYTGVHYWGTAAVEGPEDDAQGIGDLFGPYVAHAMDPVEYASLLIGWGTRVYLRFRPERHTTWDFRQ